MSKRPIIRTIDQNAAVSQEERFQNEIVRPIIKQKSNEIQFFVFKSLNLFTERFTDLSAEKKVHFIRSQFKSNQSFRNRVIGIVLGHFSEVELEQYFHKEKEINKRIIQIIEERTITQL